MSRLEWLDKASKKYKFLFLGLSAYFAYSCWKSAVKIVEHGNPEDGLSLILKNIEFVSAYLGGFLFVLCIGLFLNGILGNNANKLQAKIINKWPALFKLE